MQEYIVNIKNNFNKLNFSNIFLTLIILSFPFNYKIFLFLRLQDFFVLGFIFINIKKIKFQEFKFILLFIFFLLISCLNGYIFYEKFYFFKLAFIYKIIIPILFIFLIKDYFKFSKIDNIYLQVNLIFIFYLLYILSFYYFSFAGTYISVPKLPSSISIFNTIKQNTLLDKHLMGNLVGLFFSIQIIYQFEFIKNNSNKLFNVFILYVFLLIFSKLFESRGIYLYTLIAAYLNINYIFQNYFSKVARITINILLIFVLFVILLLFYRYDLINNYWVFYDLKYLYKIYISETTFVGMHASRIMGWYDYLSNNILILMFGRGLTSYKQLFLDNGILFIILNLGFIPSIILVLFLIKNFKINVNLPYSFKFIFYSAIIVNLFISEFYLVSRYIYILIILYFLFEIKTKTFISKKENNEKTHEVNH